VSLCRKGLTHFVGWELSVPDIVDLQLIELLYQSVTDPSLWSVALDQIVAAFDSDHATLFTNKDTAASMPFYAAAGLREDDQARYATPEAARIWTPLQMIMPSGAAISQQTLISDHDFEKTEGYQELVKPTRCYYGGFIQQDVPDLSFHMAICRPRSRGAFEKREVDALQRLLPHVTATMRLQQRLRTLEHRANALSGAIERLDHGAILCDANGRPTLVNYHANVLLGGGDGLVLGSQGLRGSNATITGQLLAAIRLAAYSTNAGALKVRIPRAAPKPPLLLDIMPVALISPAGGTRPPCVVIFITEPDAPPEIDREALADSYRLTPREAEIATMLATGATPETIATELSLTVGTVRFNLKRVFEKTGARSQAAVVALARGFIRRGKA
jgi:DNA-binding CsgD family transcriptional regulator/PAS domain-containing protein